MNHWVRQELEGACRFVLDEVSMEERSEEEWRVLADVLVRLTSFPEVLERLKALAGGAGPAAKWAAHVLELEGLVPREKVDAMAARWRGTRSFKALLEIYENYICRIAPGTVERSSLIELLGPPSGVSDALVWYDDESSQAALFLESDDRGKLIASRASWEGYRPAFRFG